MFATWKTVRVFISSTFRDMQAERDHLVRFVFPRLREELLSSRIHLVDVDLRWGVTSEQDATEVCREVIDECRPRFLCMLGGRYGWVPPGRSRSITAEEVYYGVLDQALKDRGFAYFYFRDDAATAAMVETTPGELREPQGSDNQNKLAELKQAIAAAGLNPFTYPAQWDNESRRLTGLKQFGDRVHHDLLDTMKSDPELRDRFATDSASQADEFAEEDAAMEAFVEEHSERFVLGSRETVLKELLAHASGTDSNGYVCLTGAPGSGKSALIAHLSRHSTLNSQPSTLLIRHFVGASPGSTDVRRTLRRLCNELKAGCPDITADIADDPEKLRVAFPDFLRQACVRQRVVILLDAVNQFDPASHSAGLHWLPEELPDNARVILSALDGAALEELRRRPRKPREIELKPLTAGDGEAIIEQFRKRYRKKFEPDQRAALLDKTDAGTPLYLLAALEELRTLGTYEEITRRIAELPPTTHALFAWILERLEDDDGFRDASGRRVGHELVSSFAALVGASRHGLSQRELGDLLDAGDPQGNVAALLQLLRPYLMRRGELVDFYHAQFRAAAEEVWLRTDAQRHAAHRQLAGYFRREADPEGNQSWKGETVRPFVELSFHLARSNANELAQVLFDFDWLQAKTDKSLVQDLINDYDEALRALWADDPQRSALNLAQGGIRLSAHVISDDKNQLASQLVGRMAHFPQRQIKQMIDVAKTRRTTKGPWLHPLWPSLTPPGASLRHTLAGHSDQVSSLAISADGKTVISGSRDQTVKVWDLASGDLRHTLEGYTDMTEALRGQFSKLGIHMAASNEIVAVTVTTDGRQIISVGRDKRVKCWDLASGRLLRSFEIQRAATCIKVTADGQAVVSSWAGNAMMVWDLGSGRLLRRLVGHRSLVWALAVTADGRTVVSASSDKTVRVWDLGSGHLVRTLAGHADEVRAVAVTADGRIAVSGSDDKTVKIWEVGSGRVLRTLEGHQYQVGAVAVTADGRIAVSGSDDKTVKIWDLDSGQLIHTFAGHARSISAVTITPDAKVVVSASWDGTVNVWDLTMDDCDRFVEWHRGPVVAVALGVDYGIAVSGSEDETVGIWSLDSGRPLRTLNDHRDNERVALETVGGKNVIIRAQNSEFFRRAGAVGTTVDGKRITVVITPEGKPALRIGSTIRVHPNIGLESSPGAVAIDADGTAVICGFKNGIMKRWDTASGEVLSAMAVHKSAVQAVAVSANGTTIAFGTHFSVIIRDVNSGKLLRVLKNWIRLATLNLVVNVALSADGRTVTAAFLYGTQKVWDVASGDLLCTVRRWKSRGVTALALSADGRTIISGLRSGVVEVRDARSGRLMQTLRGHERWVSAVAVTTDRSIAVSSGGDKTVRAWEVGSGCLIARFTGDAIFSSVAITTDGRNVLAGDTFGRLHFLDLHIRASSQSEVAGYSRDSTK